MTRERAESRRGEPRCRRRSSSAAIAVASAVRMSARSRRLSPATLARSRLARLRAARSLLAASARAMPAAVARWWPGHRRPGARPDTVEATESARSASATTTSTDPSGRLGAPRSSEPAACRSSASTSTRSRSRGYDQQVAHAPACERLGDRAGALGPAAVSSSSTRGGFSLKRVRGHQTERDHVRKTSLEHARADAGQASRADASGASCRGRAPARSPASSDRRSRPGRARAGSTRGWRAGCVAPRLSLSASIGRPELSTSAPV